MVLFDLRQEDGLRGGELAVRLGVEPPTVTKMLWRLEGCGLVERHQDPTDARSFRVHLTQRGRALEEPVARCWAQYEEKALAGLSAGERRTFQKLLIRVRSNLDPGFRAVDLSRQHILEMVRLIFDDRLLRVLGKGGTLRECSTSLGALRRAEPVGAVA
jgi:DNA-binding MarR family transcriptional regulator